MLDEARDQHGEPMFVLKGGSALELRYESRARASRDIDLEFSGALDDIHEAIVTCVNGGWSGFGGRVLDPQPLTIPRASVTGQRFSVQLSYLGRPFTRILLETVTRKPRDTEYVHTLRLDPMGLPSPDPIACLTFGL
jgi:hypothetical protein